MKIELGLEQGPGVGWLALGLVGSRREAGCLEVVWWDEEVVGGVVICFILLIGLLLKHVLAVFVVRNVDLRCV